MSNVNSSRDAIEGLLRQDIRKRGRFRPREFGDVNGYHLLRGKKAKPVRLYVERISVANANGSCPTVIVFTADKSKGLGFTYHEKLD